MQGGNSEMISVFLALSEHYLASVTWVTDTRVAVQWLKRVQQHLILQIYSFTTSKWNPIEVKHQERVLMLYQHENKI